jgi:hypothetical protein
VTWRENNIAELSTTSIDFSPSDILVVSQYKENLFSSDPFKLYKFCHAIVADS